MKGWHIHPCMKVTPEQWERTCAFFESLKEDLTWLRERLKAQGHRPRGGTYGPVMAIANNWAQGKDRAAAQVLPRRDKLRGRQDQSEPQIMMLASGGNPGRDEKEIHREALAQEIMQWAQEQGIQLRLTVC